LTFVKILLIINLVKKIFISVLGLLTYPFLATPVFADPTVGSISPCDGVADGIAKTLCNLGENPGKTIQSIVIFLLILAVVIALMYLLYGGIKWITSRGEKTEVEAARNHIMAAVVGLIVVFLAIFIVSIIMSVFGLSIRTSLTLPTIK
jgi:hypothetical protein